MNIFIGPITIAKVQARVYGKTEEKQKKWWPYAIPSCGLFILFILFHVLELVVTGCWAIAWFWYLGFVCQITAVRIKTREIHGIVGNASEDFFSALFFYPNVALQLDLTTDPDKQRKMRQTTGHNEYNLDHKKKVQHENGSYDKPTKEGVDASEKVNYAYEKE